MFRGSVALMILQSVSRVKRGEFGHGPVPRDFGDDRGGGDGGTAGVAIDDGDFPAGETGFLIAIDQAEVGLRPKALHRAAHREETCPENIMRFDFLDRRDADRPMDLPVRAEEGAQLGAAFGLEFLRVAKVLVPQAVGQDRRRREDRTGPAAAPDFIHSRNDRHVLGTQIPLELPGERGAASAGHGFPRVYAQRPA